MIVLLQMFGFILFFPTQISFQAENSMSLNFIHDIDVN